MAAYPAMHNAGGKDAAIAFHEAVIMSWAAVHACREFDYKLGRCRCAHSVKLPSSWMSQPPTDVSRFVLKMEPNQVGQPFALEKA